MTATGFLDACGFTPASNGTGDFVVSAAITGYQTPASANAVNATVYSYRGESSDKSQWEEGFGAYTVAGTTLARTTVTANSLGTTAKISFTVAPNVFITAASADLQNASLLTSGTVAAARLPTIAGTLIEIDTYTTTQTITIPAGATKAFIRFGAAGGGSGGSAGGSSSRPQGGGSGSALEKYLTGLTAGNTLALTMGAAGTAGASGTTVGGDAGNSTLASGTQTISTLSTFGGKGGAAPGANAPGAAGGAIATGGDINFAGNRSIPVTVQSTTTQPWPGGAPVGVSGAGAEGNGGAAAGAGIAGQGGSCVIMWFA